MRHALLLLLTAACSSQQPVEPPEQARAVLVERVPDEPAPSPRQPMPPAAATAPRVSSELVWVVTSLGPHPHPDIPAHRHRIELLVRSPDGDKLIAVGKVTGAMMPSHQNICHAQMDPEQAVFPVEPGELAKIAFFHAGSDIFAVRSARAGAYEVVNFHDGHVECDTPTCELPSKVVATFQGHLDARPSESIQLVSTGGERSSFDCR